jgi:hypothetical protein
MAKKPVRSDIQDLEDEIKQIEKEYSLRLAKVSRGPHHMMVEEFMNLLDDKRKFLISEEIHTYCERDNLVRALRDKQAEIRLTHKEYYREGIYNG